MKKNFLYQSHLENNIYNNNNYLIPSYMLNKQNANEKKNISTKKKVEKILLNLIIIQLIPKKTKI